MKSIFNSNFKEQARRFALVSSRGTVKTSLWFPGAEMPDVLESLERRLTTRKSLHILVEENLSTARKLRTRVRRHVPRAHLHEAPLEALDLGSVLKGRKLEYAWMDFCGCLREGEVLWMEDELAPRLAKDATVAITVGRNIRMNRFMRRAREVFEATGNHFLSLAYQMLSRCEVINAYPVSHDEYDPAFNEYQAVNVVYQGMQFSRRFHDSSILPLAVMLAALPSWEFDVKTCFEYPGENNCGPGRGGGHMTLLVCHNFRRRRYNRRDPLFDEVYQRLVGRKPWRQPCKNATPNNLIIQSHFRGSRKRAWSKKRMTETCSPGERAAITRKVRRLAQFVGYAFPEESGK
jgi:hypothetical protein